MVTSRTVRHERHAAPAKVAFAFAFVALAAPRTARAYDAEVDAQTVGQAYQLKGVTGDPVLSRRRVTQTLQLGVYNLTDTTKVDAPEVLFRARVRLDADFGTSNEETTLAGNPTTSRFVPLLSPAPIDLMYAYLEGRKFAKGWIGFKIGRQYVTDPLGWYGFDGGLIRVTTPAYFMIEAYGGFEARGGLPLTSNTNQSTRWDLGGVMRTDRGSYPLTAYPSVQPQSLAPMWGVALESAGPTWIHGRLTYRKAWNTGSSYVAGSGALLGPDQMGIYDHARTSSERLGWGGHVDIGKWAQLRGNLIYDLYGQQWNDIEAGIDGYLGKRVTASFDYTYFKPIFDADSIFNVFGIEPMDDFTARAEVDVTDRFQVSADAMLRRYRSDDSADASKSTSPTNTNFNVATSTAPGGGLRARYRWPTAKLMLRGSGITGDQGMRVGADVAYDKVFAERWLFDGRVSLWRFSDKLRADANGNTRDATSVGYVVGAGYRFSPEANGMLQWEHDMNRLVGMRYRVLAVLNVRVWL